MLPERIATRDAVLGDGLRVRRALPSRQRRMVGAWCFLDHLGPIDYSAGGGLAVGPHPHLGLQTFTWMIAGEVIHRDSLGNEQAIRPGQVNLMSAGHGIAHSEDAPLGRGGHVHAVQLWIALDEAHRHGPPAFQHYPLLPVVERGGGRSTLLVGSLFGQTSPVAVYSPLLAVDVELRPGAEFVVPLQPTFEYAALVLTGTVDMAGAVFAPGTLAYFGSGNPQLVLGASAPARVILIGGAPFAEEVLVWWNFVARTQAELAAAVAEWNHGERFGVVRGSPSPRVPAPDVQGLRLRQPRA